MRGEGEERRWSDRGYDISDTMCVGHIYVNLVQADKI